MIYTTNKNGDLGVGVLLFYPHEIMDFQMLNMWNHGIIHGKKNIVKHMGKSMDENMV